MAKTKKITNFNAMRPAIITAHNEGNRKAISKDMVLGAGIDNEFFVLWQSDVEKLRETVWDYVQKKKNGRFDSKITDADIYAARERIYPKWKDILSVGEAGVDTKELHVQESDVEDLIGFAWDFMATTKGTVETRTTSQIFRKKVESLLGCAIARNTILDDGERDTLQKFYSAQNRIQNCLDTKAELTSSLKNYEEMKANLPETEKAFIAYIDKMILEVKEQIKAVDESKANAEKDQADVSAKAKEIEQKIAKAK